MSLAYLALALRDAHVIELRHAHGQRWTSGLFDHINPLRAAIRSLAGTGNLYIALNRPRPGLPIPNAMTSKPLRSEDIIKIVRIPVDFDPVRPAECMSTDAEMALAVTARNRFVAAMSACGWPMPLLGMSGSGAHALYRCSINSSSALNEMLEALYRGWRSEFSTVNVEFDTKVRNAGRVWRLYGTKNRKGLDTLERPWRRSRCDLPVAWQVVQLRQIEDFANRYIRELPRPAAVVAHPRLVGSGDYRTLNVVGWMRSHGLYKRHLGGGKHAVSCPWASEHSTKDHPLGTDSVVFEATSGEWPGFYCSHAHCDGRGMRELIAHFGDADAFCGRAFKVSA